MEISQRPLREKRVLLACSAMKAEKLASGLQELGAEVLPFEAVEIREVDDHSALDDSLRRIREYAWIIFTSAYAVQFFSNRLSALGLSGLRENIGSICAVGPATASALVNRGFQVSLVPKDFVAEGVIEALSKEPGGLAALNGKQILLPRAKEARDVIPDALKAAGARVEVVACYETVAGNPGSAILAEIQRRPPDLLVFTSSSSVGNFVRIVGTEQAGRILSAAHAAVIGSIAGKTLESFGKKPDILPQSHTVDDLLDAIAQFYR